MPQYRRSKIPGTAYFFTVVTHHRQPLLTEPKSRLSLRQTIMEVRFSHPFKVDAWVLLPDHMHCIWTLPENDHDFSKRWGLIKAGFTKKVGRLFYREELASDSRRDHREATIWQRRFWEHQIRDETDYQRHMDYIHFNPVKHGLVKQVKDWPYSTFHKYVANGLYPENWGDIKLESNGQYGE
ncbi:MAG TPA: transposase [Gammaproteobacteria bacterium]